MHVASTTLFEGPVPDYDDFREHIESRLHLVPRFRQKLRFVPFGQGRPKWVDDPQFNLDYHIRHTALPAPGSEEQLRTLAARIFSQRLDRSKPLWEMWLVDGVERGRFAIVTKTHHCLVDGVSGVDITTVLFDAAPEPDRPRSGRRLDPHPEPSDAEVLGRGADRARHQPDRDRPRRRAVFRAPRPCAGGGRRARGGRRRSPGPGSAPRPPRSTSRSAPTGASRWSAPTAGAEADQERRRRHRQRRRARGGHGRPGALPARARALDPRAWSCARWSRSASAPPTSTGALGNRVSAYMAPLPVWCDDPVERLALVSATMGDLKQSKQAVGATLMTELTDFAPPTIAGQAARLQSRQRFFNLVVTNVPGPQFPPLPDGPRARGGVPDGAAGQAPGGLLRDHELQRPGQLRPDRRLRRDGRPRGARPRPRGLARELGEAAPSRPVPRAGAAPTAARPPRPTTKG